ncbi:MAG: DnaA regulatory inactivator Hda [Rhodoferax sp.]|uniref:DnaA regulatory inactivator Hda n=1 Tax=Rhodoferax sp. TaxID=50421 RepID=UPI0026258DEB|nr:DnaA regulatory inactivator Hda [Rhodoferax sp.]MDD2882408.1 DnaA regulatory inactivator Hda [Rhodoferax sp.]
MQQLVLDMGLPTGPSLKNFCAGPNEAAVAHLTLWLGDATSTLRSPVPTYLWGGNGCGKTHLLQALRAALQQQGESVGWLDPNVQAPPEFDENWACVLMDDVHAFNTELQHVAFNWFVHAQTLQLAVLAAGSLPPADLKLRDDLRTRLGWGHVFALQALSEPERRAVLRQAADTRGIFLTNEVMDFMLTRFSRDLGSLMELLDLMDGYALQTQRAVTIPLIKTMMDNT